MRTADLRLMRYLVTAPEDVEHRDASHLSRELGDISGLNALDQSGLIAWVAFRGWFLTDKGKQAIKTVTGVEA